MSEPPSGGMSRRDVLVGAAAAAAGITALTAAGSRAHSAVGSIQQAAMSDAFLGASATRGIVGLSRDPAVFDAQGRVRPNGVQSLLDQALKGATGAPDATMALTALFKPSDVVGIKLSCLPGRGLSTHAELVDALIARLVAAGVRADNIIVWDRSDRDLRRAGFPLRRSGSGPLYFGTNDDYENEPIEAGSVGGCLSKILTRKVTAIVNVPVLKDHDLAGISGALKSFYGAIHNPNKYHDNNCSPYVADLYAYPTIRNKVRLTVFDALEPQYQGGPAWVPANCWRMSGVFASTDPVAADATALKIIAAKRLEMGIESLEQAKRAPLWLPQAQALGLGVADLSRVKEVTP